MGRDTLRERNKADKLNRIRDAARHLFGTRGFDLTSTRDIATRADVGLATLFLYASDKRDLLFLACNEDLSALTDRAYAASIDQTSFAEKLEAFFREFYAFYGANRLLSKEVLRELTFYTTGMQSEKFQANRQRTIERIEQLVRFGRERGEVESASLDADIARLLFYVFAAEVRRWLGSANMSEDEGLHDLMRLIRIVFAGLERA